MRRINATSTFINSIMNSRIDCVSGKAIAPFVDDLAKLRIKIFQEYPYFYQGKLDNERNHLKIYLDCPESVLIVISNNTQIMGMATGIPLKFAAQIYQQPFIDHQIATEKIFYLGELLLLPAYRGQHLCRHLLQKIEAFAAKTGYEKMTSIVSLSRE